MMANKKVVMLVIFTGVVAIFVFVSSYNFSSLPQDVTFDEYSELMQREDLRNRDSYLEFSEDVMDCGGLKGTLVEQISACRKNFVSGVCLDGNPTVFCAQIETY